MSTKKSKTGRARMRELAQLSVAARKAKKQAQTERPAWPLTDAKGRPRAIGTPDDAELVASWAAETVALGHLSAAEGKTVTTAVSAWRQAHVAGALSKRLDELQEIVHEIEKRGSVKQQARIRDLERQLQGRPGGLTTKQVQEANDEDEDRRRAQQRSDEIARIRAGQ